MRLWMANLTWKQTPLLIFLFSYAAYFRNELAHVLVIERVRATIQFKTYEWCRQPYFTAIWFIFVVSCFVFNLSLLVVALSVF
jgi:hypothetical protein